MNFDDVVRFIVIMTVGMQKFLRRSKLRQGRLLRMTAGELMPEAEVEMQVLRQWQNRAESLNKRKDRENA